MISIRHREELHLRTVVIPTQVYAILWRSSFVYTSALIRKSCNHNSHGTQDYQSHSTRLYKQRKTPTSEHSGVITLRKLILAPPRGDDIYISFSYYFCMIFFQSPPEFTTEPVIQCVEYIRLRSNARHCLATSLPYQREVWRDCIYS